MESPIFPIAGAEDGLKSLRREEKRISEDGGLEVKKLIPQVALGEKIVE